MKNKIRNFVFITCLTGFYFTFANAHVNLIQPSGGETFLAGTQMFIEWQQTVNHGVGNWELYFTADGGLTWQQILSNYPITENADLISYNWQIPNSILTDQGQIRVVQNNASGRDYESTSMVFVINVATSLIDNNVHSKRSFILNNAYPNPFNGSTVISFELAELSDVKINIYDFTGRKIEKLLQKQLAVGEHKVRWVPNNLASGVYFYTIATTLNSQTRRLIYLK